MASVTTRFIVELRRATDKVQETRSKQWQKLAATAAKDEACKKIDRKNVQSSLLSADNMRSHKVSVGTLRLEV